MSKSGWIIERLEKGETISTRLHGNSMRPRIESGSLVTIEPVKPEDVQIGDIVYCCVKGNCYAHLVQATGTRGFLIANNHGHVNGWTHKVYGRVTKVEK